MWPNSEIPAVAAGIYTICDGPELMYAGMAGRSLTADSILTHHGDVTSVNGPRSRLYSHASGRRSGDQFCLYVGNLLVLDNLVCKYIRERFAYRYVETPDGEVGRLIEMQVRRGALSKGRPFLNPL